MSTTNSIEFNLKDSKDFINFIIDNNRKNNKKGIKKKIAFQLIGEAGIGKTSAVLQICEERKIDHYKLNLSQIEELGDLVGFPIKKYFIQKEQEGKNVEKSVSEKQLNAWYRAGWKPVDKDPVMSYAPPEWIMNRPDSGILILDDWTRGENRFIQAIMELIDRGQYISWKLPPDWHIILK